ncbi:MAG: FecR family protein [Planctomycetaceae bacterium]|nr:FecR family protein [Planctomycetaceae bacterium]
MNSSARDFRRVNELIEFSLEGSIAPEQYQQLNDWIVSDPAIRRHYCEYIQLTVGIERLSANISAADLPQYDSICDLELWDQLAHQEKTAPELASPPQPHELIRKVVYPPREKRKISKFNVFILLNAAAVLMIVLFARFVTPQAGLPVATLTESVNAKWADAEHMVKGQRFVTGSTNLLLREGCAELLFDNNARVTIEAPAEFQILTDDQIKLNYGRVYAVVPDQAYGFTISTSNGKIIDLGTEFGVQRNPYGDTELHVLKGRTNLIANTQGRKINISVTEGAARKLVGSTGEVRSIVLQNDLFVRKIDSESSLMWQGQMYFSLADAVGGGSGFGSGGSARMIDPASGRSTKEDAGTRASTNDYRPIASNLCIDGVFVPNGSTSQIVSSQGHLFEQCPVTNGLCCEEIKAVTTMDFDVVPDPNIANVQMRCLFLHANMGITFDLDAVRKVLPDVSPVRFQSKCGIRKWALRPTASNADFWVLVDGKVRFKREHVKIGQIHSIDIELSQNDRFLTLVETDGGDPQSRTLNGVVLSANDSDWGYFADPLLVLK